MHRIPSFARRTLAARWVARRRPGRKVDEQGFTLFELLIVMLIMPIVVGALAFAVVSIFSLTGSTQTKLSGGSNSQTISPMFQEDADNAIAFTTCPNVDGEGTCSPTANSDAQCGSKVDTLVATFAFATPAQPNGPLTPTTPFGGPLVSYMGVPVAAQSTTVITAASADGTNFTFTAGNTFLPGQQITVTGVTPAAYDGVWTVNTASSVNFTVANTAQPGPGTAFGTAQQLLYNLVRNYCANGASDAPSSSTVIAEALSGSVIQFLESTCSAGTCTVDQPSTATGAAWIYAGYDCEGISALSLTITEADDVTSSTFTAAPRGVSQLAGGCTG